MISILRTLLAVNEIKLYSACTRFGSPQLDIAQGFARPDYSIKLSFIHTVTKNKFKITPQNLYNVVHNLEIAVNWFYDPNMKDMFYIEDETLNFNYDYAKLYVNASSPDGNHIEIRPVVDYSRSERGNEGIVMYINDTESQTIMQRSDLEAFYIILKNFSFQTEALLLLYELDRSVKEYVDNGGTINDTDTYNFI